MAIRKGFGSVRPAVILAVMQVVSGCAAFRGGAVPVAAAVSAWSEEGFTGRRIVTEHFEIVSTLRDQAFEAALPTFLEAAYQRYTSMLAPPRSAGRKLRVYVFGTRNEWAQFARRRYPSSYPVYARIRSGGFTEGGTAVVFYVTRAGTLATLAHEGWHQYVGARFQTPIPAWLNEGLACYHEAVEFGGRAPKFTPRHNTFRINDLRQALQSDRLLTLHDILTTDAGEAISHTHSRRAPIYYAQTWALITFLRHGANRRYAAAFQHMLNDITDGTFPVRVSAARLGRPDQGKLSLSEAVFPAYFGWGPDQIAGEYDDYLVQLCGF